MFTIQNSIPGPLALFLRPLVTESYRQYFRLIYASGMERNQWPPLEEVREWAARKLGSGHVVPSSTGRYVNLIALIDEILVSQATSSADGKKNPAEEESVSR
jgi:hypothetical protein